MFCLCLLLTLCVYTIALHFLCPPHQKLPITDQLLCPAGTARHKKREYKTPLILRLIVILLKIYIVP